MFEVAVEHEFAAGHALRGYKGKCENVHGHNYKIQVVVAGEELDSVGLLVDFKNIRSQIHSTADRLDHQFLNDLPPFDRVNPSAENLAKYFFEEIQQNYDEESLKVKSVTVWENSGTWATYHLGEL